MNRKIPEAASEWNSDRIRLLMLIVATHRDTGRPPTWAEMTRFGGRERVSRNLAVLRDEGLISFDSDKKGTLRPLVGVV